MLPVGRSPDTICSASRCLLHPLVSLGKRRPSWKGPRLSVFTYPPSAGLSLDVSFPRLPLSRPPLSRLPLSLHSPGSFLLPVYPSPGLLFFLSFMCLATCFLPLLLPFLSFLSTLVSPSSCLLFSCSPFPFFRFLEPFPSCLSLPWICIFSLIPIFIIYSLYFCSLNSLSFIPFLYFPFILSLSLFFICLVCTCFFFPNDNGDKSGSNITGTGRT